jgi:hypothetical protein
MCSNDSPSEIADGTTDAATLAEEYEEYILDIEEQPLPSYRTEELRARIGVVRDALTETGVASAGQLQHLLRVITEALADAREARVVAAPAERDLTAVVPGFSETGAAYEVTPTEQRKTVNVLVDLLFTVVETPTHEDRRAGRGDGEAATAVAGRAAADTTRSGADRTDTERGAGVDGYAGPE